MVEASLDEKHKLARQSWWWFHGFGPIPQTAVQERMFEDLKGYGKRRAQLSRGSNPLPKDAEKVRKSHMRLR